MAFKSGLVPEDWRSDAFVPLYNGKGEIVECNNYVRNVIGKIYA